MFCINCGAKVIESAVFCQSCGKPIADENSPSIITEDTSVSTTCTEDLPKDTAENMNSSEILAESEVIIYGHSVKSKAKTKVYCNNQYVGTVSRDESIVVPISTDSTIEFKCGFVKKRFPVKYGEVNEVKIEISTLFGNICVFDLHSPNCLEKIEKMKKRDKILRPLLIVVVIALFLKDGLVMMSKGPEVLRQTSEITENDMNSEDLASLTPDSQTQNATQSAHESIDVNSNMDETLHEDFEPEVLYPGELLYKRVPLSSLLGVPKNSLREKLGAPLSDDYNLIDFDGISFNYNYLTEEVAYILVSPDMCEIDGTTLDKNRDDLIAVLGNPDNEDYDDEGAYQMSYTMPKYSLIVMLPAPEDNAYRAYVGFDLNNYVEVEEISIQLPSTWDYYYEEVGGYIFFDVHCENENIVMSVFQSRDVTDDVRSYTFDGTFSVNKIAFDDGTEGHYAYDDTRILFTYGDGDVHYFIDYSGDPKWYEENKALIYAVAKTLKYEYVPYEWDDGSISDQSDEPLSADGYIISSGSTVYVEGGGWSPFGSRTEGRIIFTPDGGWSITWVAVLEDMGLSGWQRSELYRDGLAIMFYSHATERAVMFHSPSNVSLDMLYLNP